MMPKSVVCVMKLASQYGHFNVENAPKFTYRYFEFQKFPVSDTLKGERKRMCGGWRG